MSSPTLYTIAKNPRQEYQREINLQPAKAVTKNMLDGSLGLLQESLSLIGPKYSFFLIGIELLKEEESRGYCRGYNHELGALLIMASPVVAVVKMSIAVPGMIIGGVGAAISGPACLANQCKNKILGNNEEAKYQPIKQDLATLFAKRVKMILNQSNLDPSQKLFFLENPKEFVILSTLSLAFQSRNCPNDRITMINKQRISRDEIAKIGDDFLDYFDNVREMADLINSIDEVKNKDWNELMLSLDRLSNGNTSYSLFSDIQKLNELSTKAHLLAETICNDPIFINAFERN